VATWVETPDALLALGYLVVFGSLAAFSAYTWLLQHAPISRVATYAYVNPVVAVVLGAVILSESITPAMLVGGAVIVTGVALIIRHEAGVRRARGGRRGRRVVAVDRGRGRGGARGLRSDRQRASVRAVPNAGRLRSTISSLAVSEMRNQPGHSTIVPGRTRAPSSASRSLKARSFGSGERSMR